MLFYQQQGTPRLVVSSSQSLGRHCKQFKRSVKAAEVMTALNTSNTPETATQTVTDVESLVQKKCKVTVKAYGEEIDNLTRAAK
jgi:hypothetical protein